MATLKDVVALPARSTRFVEQNRLYSQADPPPLSRSTAAWWVSGRKPGNSTLLKLAQSQGVLAEDWYCGPYEPVRTCANMTPEAEPAQRRATPLEQSQGGPVDSAYLRKERERRGP
jgi:hypothetical protein